MQLRTLGQSELKVSPIGLGTWVMGGWLWGGIHDEEAIQAIEISLKNGINLIDTAPVYGFGKSETLVGKALKRTKLRDKVVLATKCGLEWDPSKTYIRRNSSKRRIFREIDDSLRRLQTDVIDLYQVHWPDENTPFSETFEALTQLRDLGKIRVIGVSNYNEIHLREALRQAPLSSLQPPYNLFERGIEKRILPWCQDHHVGTLTYGALCRGLLSGKFTESASFSENDIRSFDPKFKGETLKMYLNCLHRLKKLAESAGMSVGQLAILWTLHQPGVTSALVGARNATQALENALTLRKHLYSETLAEIEKIISEEIHTPIGPEFMAPPLQFSFSNN